MRDRIPWVNTDLVYHILFKYVIMAIRQLYCLLLLEVVRINSNSKMDIAFRMTLLSGVKAILSAEAREELHINFSFLGFSYIYISVYQLRLSVWLHFYIYNVFINLTGSDEIRVLNVVTPHFLCNTSVSWWWNYLKNCLFLLRALLI